MVESYKLPLFPLHTVLFPGQRLPLHIFEPRYRQLVADCLDAERTFGVVLIREGVEVGGSARPHEVGTSATIEHVERLPDGRMNIVTLGRERFRIHSCDTESKPYLVGWVSFWPWFADSAFEAASGRSLRQHLERYISLLSQASDVELTIDQIPQNPAQLALLASVVLQIPPEQKQQLLEIPSVDELAPRLSHLLRQESRALQLMLDSVHLQGELYGLFSQN